ncbi:MAG TPA: GAF domain-containing protein, partial [Chloroflexota bacterium]|nr:GAF domain-containing protein [Chloroflexota bacterium]
MKDSTITALVAVTMVLAATVNFFLLPPSYLVSAPYAVPILIATWRWAPRAIGGVGLLSTLLYLAATYSGATPLSLWPIGVSSLAIVTILAITLSYQRSETLRKASEAALASEQLRRSNERLTLLSETTSQLLLSEAPHAIVGQLFERLSRHLELEVYFHFVVDTDGQSLRLASYSGVPEAFARQIERMEFGQNICGYVAQTRQFLCAEDIQGSDDRRSDQVRSVGISAFVSYPLVAHDQLTGTLSFGTRNRSTFAPADLVMMHTVADQVAMALERSRLTQELQKQAQTQQFLAESSAIVTSS